MATFVGNDAPLVKTQARCLSPKASRKKPQGNFRLASCVQENANCKLVNLELKPHQDSLQNNISEVTRLTQSLLSKICQPNGRINITIYSLMWGGFGDFMHGVQLQRYLLDTIPNLNLHWVLFYETKKKLEIIQSLLRGFQDLKSVVYFFETRKVVLSNQKQLRNHPPSLSIICPVKLEREMVEKFPISIEDSIFLGEITDKDYICHPAYVNLKFGFHERLGIGLPFKHPSYTQPYPLDRCPGSYLLPRNRFFFSYFYCKISEGNFINWYNYIEIMHAISPDAVKTLYFVSNMEADDCFFRLIEPESSKKLCKSKSRQTYMETMLISRSCINRVIYFKKQKDNTFSQQIFSINPKARRWVCIVNPFPLQNHEFYTYMRESHRIVGCTGDSSLSEAVSLNKIPYYDSFCAYKLDAIKQLALYTRFEDMAHYLLDLHKNKTNVDLLLRLLAIKAPLFELGCIPNAYEVISRAILAGLSPKNESPPHV